MKYKLIAADMDGTLLTDDKRISARTREAIKAAVKKGVIFTVSTGRPIQAIRCYEELRELGCPVITYNGAVIAEPDTEKIIYEQSLEREDALRILEYGTERKLTMCVWCGGQLYVNMFNERTDYYKRMTKVEPVLLEDADALANKGITKILWYDDAEKIAAFEEEMKAAGFNSVTACTSQPMYLEFFNRKVSKAAAIQRICDIYGIKRTEVIAVGDANNDLEMIEYAGLGVAMANAVQNVREKADFVTLSNEEDGVAYVIEKFVLTAD